MTTPTGPMEPERLAEAREHVKLFKGYPPVLLAEMSTCEMFIELLADRDYWSRAHHEVSNSLVIEQWRRIVAERDAKRWRARCPVTVEDVLAREVTPDRALAYALASGWQARDEDDVAELESEAWALVELVPAAGDGRADAMVLCNNLDADGPRSIASACNLIAKDEGRAPQDVLDEMAAIIAGMEAN